MNKFLKEVALWIIFFAILTSIGLTFLDVYRIETNIETVELLLGAKAEFLRHELSFVGIAQMWVQNLIFAFGLITIMAVVAYIYFSNQASHAKKL